MINSAQYTEKTSRGSLPAGGSVVCSSDGSAEISVKGVLASHDIEPLVTRFFECVCCINEADTVHFSSPPIRNIS